MDWSSKKEELKDLIEVQGKKYEDVGRQYGISGTYVKKLALKFGIKIIPRRAVNPSETFNKLPDPVCKTCGKAFKRRRVGDNIYCSKQCAGKGKRDDKIKQWKNGCENGTSGFTCSSMVRNYMLNKVNYKCEKCGWGEENLYTHKIPLQIHYLDGNSLNNEESNLQVLCPNCHSLTENFGSKNKNAPNGKSKYYRRSK